MELTYGEKILVDRIKDDNWDAIVVEGYDGVGKGRVLNILSDLYGVTPYRPDYNFWQKYDLRKKDRWMISGAFWDIYHNFFHHRPEPHQPMIFDRGVMSGAVYNDPRLTDDYKYLLGDLRVLHILVTCEDKKDYRSFCISRNPNITDDEIDKEWSKYLEFTERYSYNLRLSEVTWILYKNRFSNDVNNKVNHTCSGCGHYSYGWCRHPIMNCKVSGDKERCNLSYDKEVQDIND